MDWFQGATDLQFQLHAVQLQQTDRLQQLRGEVQLLAQLGRDGRLHGGAFRKAPQACGDGMHLAGHSDGFRIRESGEVAHDFPDT